jgi:hypothetical protein
MPRFSTTRFLTQHTLHFSGNVLRIHARCCVDRDANGLLRGNGWRRSRAQEWHNIGALFSLVMIAVTRSVAGKRLGKLWIIRRQLIHFLY